MDRAADRRARVVDMWRALELLSPQTVARTDPRNGVIRAEPGRPLPWEAAFSLPKPAPGPGRARVHRVLLGVYGLEDLFDALNRVMPADDDTYYDPPVGESAIGALLVTDDGELAVSSATLSSCAWATGRAHHPGHRHPDWLHGFEAAQTEFSQWLGAQLVPDDDADVPATVDFELLARCRDWIVDLCGIAGLLDTSEIRVETRTVISRAPEDADAGRSAESDFLNSFFVNDLTRVSRALRRGDYGRALSLYLRPEEEIDRADRVDIRQRADVAADLTQPGRVPLGRWPAKATHPLALGQQLAVDAIVATLGPADGLFAVNGPPGTGKTTLLRDLIASTVVDRATRLSALGRPQDAFVPGATHEWKTGGYRRELQTWRADLAPQGIVVASANNAAVENVTNEVPARDAVDPAWDTTDCYLPEIATNVLNADRPRGDRSNLRPAWALVAARLGNRAHRSRFAKAFWHGPWPTDPRKAGAPSGSGMLAQLKAWEAAVGSTDWTAEVARFRAALAAAGDDQRSRADAYAAWADLPAATERAAAARRSALAAAAALEVARARASEHEPTLGSRQGAREDRVRVRSEHRRFRPNLAQAILGRRSYRAWQARDDELATAIQEADRAMAGAVEQAAALAGAATAAEQAAVEDDRAAVVAETRVVALQHTVDTARAAWHGFVPTPDRWDDPVARERAAPWTDPEWNTSRTELFLAALRLHKAFLACCPTLMRKSLHAAMDVVSGDAPADLAEEAARQAWAALFFVVPVVSTTFASFDRLFSHLGREALGWLLVDEAGQAAPQLAAGAIWRSRRVVCVGDPLQLEPVVTLPSYAQRTIRRRFDVDERWLPDVSSVQSLADRVTPVGTYVGDGDDRLWVGAPLRVHRRCDDPMFTISNRIAYDGTMVNAVDRTDELAFPVTGEPVPRSAWLDVRSERSDGHWVPAEGARLVELLRSLAEGGQDFTQVFALSPFRVVARHLEDLSRRDPFKGMIAGTVHRSQGREADIVILVLGGDPRSPGAKRWAARKPNLVNVATSRARRRLYVIGDRAAWGEHRHFDVVAALLPTEPPPPGR